MATIWGYNKHGLPRCFALNIPNSEVDEFVKKAEGEGWSGLVVDRNPQPSLFGEDDASASSEKDTSRSTKGTSSGT